MPRPRPRSMCTCRARSWLPGSTCSLRARASWTRWPLPAGSRPTGIFSTWDSDAELIYLAVGRLGFRVPGDVSLVSLGGAWRTNALTRRLTSVTLDEDQAGHAAARLLEEMSNGRRPLDGQFQSSIPLQLYQGETLQPVCHNDSSRKRAHRLATSKARDP